jgi:hypothetical protein
MDNYEEKRQNRILAYQELAKKFKKQSEELCNQSINDLKHIPAGQPILVGHHSEKRHRRDLEKSDNKMRKSIELAKKAEYYEEKAKSALCNASISSDDPNAIEKLQEQLKDRKDAQEKMKTANKIVKSKKLQEVEKIEKLQEIGIPEKYGLILLQPDFCGRFGFPPYKLSNNNAGIKRIENRIKTLEAAAQRETKEEIIKGVTCVHNTEDNRLQLFFDGKPEFEVRKSLKRFGFRWSNYNGCWQRQLTNNALWSARSFFETYEEP